MVIFMVHLIFSYGLNKSVDALVRLLFRFHVFEMFLDKVTNQTTRWCAWGGGGGSGPGGGSYMKFWVGVCGTLLETLTVFQTKICDSISDLTQNLIPYV